MWSVGFSGTRVIDSCELSCRFWELNLGPLEELSVLLTVEPSLQCWWSLLNHHYLLVLANQYIQSQKRKGFTLVSFSSKYHTKALVESLPPSEISQARPPLSTLLSTFLPPKLPYISPLSSEHSLVFPAQSSNATVLLQRTHGYIYHTHDPGTSFCLRVYIAVIKYHD